MTQLQFTTQLLDIINDLFEAGITSCNIYQARLELDYLFNQFEEYEDTQSTLLEDVLHNIEAKKPFSTDEFFKDLYDIVNMPFGEYESGLGYDEDTENYQDYN